MNQRTFNILLGAAFIAAMAFFAHLGYRTRTVIVAAEQRTLVVTAINPPKHMYVTLRDEGDGEVYEVFAGKHCNSWRELQIGSRWVMTRVTQRYVNDGNREVWSIAGGSSVCAR